MSHLRYLIGKVFALALVYAVVVSVCVLIFSFLPGRFLHGYDVGSPFSDATLGHDRTSGHADISNVDTDMETLVAALRFDFGESKKYGTDVLELVASRLRFSLVFQGAGFLLVIAMAVGLAYLLELLPAPARSMTEGAIALTQAIPVFLLGVLSIIVFGAPVVSISEADFWPDILLPLLVLTFSPTMALTLEFRSFIQDVFSRDLVLAVRAKGLSDWQILIRHVSRLMIPFGVAEAASMSAWFLFSGAVVERLFQLPGASTLLFEAILERDAQLATGLIAIGGVISFVMISLMSAYLHRATRHPEGSAVGP